MVATVVSLLGQAPAVAAQMVPTLTSIVLVCWGFSYISGVSVTYICRLVYSEITLVYRRAALESKAPGTLPDKPPKLTEQERSTPLRGVAVPDPATYTSAGQTLPPSKKVKDLLPKDSPPEGEQLPYDTAVLARVQGSSWHFGRAAREATALGEEEDEAWQSRLRCLREGAEVHRQVRQFVQQKVRPGMELREIVEMVDSVSSKLVGFDPEKPLARGSAFPTGLSLNEVAAHDTVNPGDPARWLLPTDLAKLDFGIHIEGHILDCAFSFTFSDIHDTLMAAVKEATNTGIRHAGPDALVSEIGGCIREVMEAAEDHRPDGKVVPIYAIKNLTGHSIAPYKIHAGKSVPSVNTGGRVRMLAGELWAVETFGSSGGVGYVANGKNCSHFMRPSSDAPGKMQRAGLSADALSLLELINRRFSTLAFCPRWVVQEATRCKSPLLKGKDAKWWQAPLNELCTMGVVQSYPPLADLPGCSTAQYEHTILLRHGGKEVLTRGTDF